LIIFASGKIMGFMSKTYFKTLAFFVASAVLLFTACSKKDTKQDTDSKGLPASGGKTLEVVLVVPEELYNGEVKDSVGTYFMKACKGLSQPWSTKGLQSSGLLILP